MKRLFKKNQVIVTTLALMIAVAGYLNYSGKIFPEKQDTKEASSELANQELLDISEEDTAADSGDIESQDAEVEGTPGEAVLTNAQADSIVAEAKVAREQTRSKNKETLMGIINDTNVTEEQKQDAIDQMITMTDLAEKETTVETLLKSKGFSEAVVSLTEDSADVVVNSEELNEANRAQIVDIISRKAGIAPENIVITPIRSDKAGTEQGGEGETQQNTGDNAQEKTGEETQEKK